jgi:hypothetical protein
MASVQLSCAGLPTSLHLAMSEARRVVVPRMPPLVGLTSLLSPSAGTRMRAARDRSADLLCFLKREDPDVITRPEPPWFSPIARPASPARTGSSYTPGWCASHNGRPLTSDEQSARSRSLRSPRPRRAHDRDGDIWITSVASIELLRRPTNAIARSVPDS